MPGQVLGSVLLHSNKHPPFVQVGKWPLLLKLNDLNYILTPGIKCLEALV